MIVVALKGPTDVAGWRAAARRLDALGTPPQDVVWRMGGEESDLFAAEAAALTDAVGEHAGRNVPRAFSEMLDTLLLHRDRERFALAYKLLFRTREEPRLLDLAADPDVLRARLMVKAVSRDKHKMKAFVRFRAVETPDGERMVAWFEPDHYVTAAVAPFFMRRFAGMRWSILTPDASAHWDLKSLLIGPGAAKDQAPGADAREEDWRAYYASIFNPARLKIAAMKKEMPVRYWRNLPEAELIKPLIRSADSRVRDMRAHALRPCRHAGRMETPMDSPERAPSRADDAIELTGLETLKPALDRCRRCPLFADATQGVPGEGPALADIMFVGEQPGDQEDLAGRPFVGPAGQLFDIALERSGIDRTRAYVTNAVKHFKFQPRGKRRIHQKPNTSEIDACRWWLEGEVKLVRPKLIVALGATGAFGVTGKAMPVQQSRGVVIRSEDWPVDRRRSGVSSAGNRRPDLLVTVHPSFLLRLQTREDKVREWRAFLKDLRLAKAHVESLAA